MKVAGGQLQHVSGAERQKPHGGRVREGITPPAGGSRQIFKFCIPRDAFWCIFRAKKRLFGGHCKLNYKQEFSSKYHSDKCSNDFYSVDTWLAEIRIEYSLLLLHLDVLFI